MDNFLLYGVVALWFFASGCLALQVYWLQKLITKIEADHADEVEILEAEIEEMKNDHESQLDKVEERIWEEAHTSGYYEGRGWKEYGEP